MTKNFRTWEFTRSIRGFVIRARNVSSLFLQLNFKKILVVLLLVSFLFQTVAYAAVPVYMVNPKSDPGNVFVVNFDEKSVETFMFTLFNKLAQRNEDFTTSFELTKIEKAREDVNKLMQESLKELHDYGVSFGVNQDQVTGSGQLLSSIKGNRIINSPFDYLFTEPKEAGRIAGICYYLNVIADQRGWLGSSSPLTNFPKATFSDYFGSNLDLITTASAINTYTDQSVERLWRAMAEFLYATDPGPGKQEEFLLNERQFLDVSATTNQQQMNRSVGFCAQIMAAYGISTPSRAAVTLDVYKASGFDLAAAFNDDQKRRAYLLKKIGLPSLIARGPRDEQKTLMRESNNTLGGIGSNASSLYGKVSSQITTLNQSSFVAGQGMRPENLYVLFPDSTYTQSTFLLNTQYVISPAVILLQKMQAATQAEFDLAGQGYLALDPSLSRNPTLSGVLGQYNVQSNLPPAGVVENPKTSVRGVCNSPPDPSIPQTCFLLDPWLTPATAFRSITNNGNPLIPNGLPAPFEDENSYLNIGTNYRINDYRPVPNAGDNIGSKTPGADYSINDWFDRVLEMYEVYEDKTDYFVTYGLPSYDLPWRCYIATWYQKMKNPSSFNLWEENPTGAQDWQNFCHPDTDKTY